jgi:phosphohistidine phosphatase
VTTPTPRRLVLIRHAKAAQGGIDTERPLAERGLVDAAAVGRWLAERKLVPDRVVVSPARRASQTWQLAGAEVAAAAQPVVDERVYDNTLGDLLQIVRESPPDVRTLALVGHNPSIAELASVLDDRHGETVARQELAQKYPTSGIAVFELGIEWELVDFGTGTLRQFAAPRGPAD